MLAWLKGLFAGPGTGLEAFGVDEITSEAQLQQAIENSAGRGVLLFKHSTTCPISAAAHREVANYLKQAEAPLPVYLLKVIESRPVSLKAADQLGVTHQSPQAIHIRDGAAAWHASHGSITARQLQALTN